LALPPLEPVISGALRMKEEAVSSLPADCQGFLYVPMQAGAFHDNCREGGGVRVTGWWVRRAGMVSAMELSGRDTGTRLVRFCAGGAVPPG
jgi:hypothetical protein